MSGETRDAPDRLGTLLGRVFVERHGWEDITAEEGRAIDLFPDERVRELAEILGCAAEALAQRLAPWASRGVREHGLGAVSRGVPSRKEVHDELEMLAKAAKVAREALKRLGQATGLSPEARAALEEHMPKLPLAGFGIAAGFPWPVGDFVVKLHRGIDPILNLTKSLIQAAEAAAAHAKPPPEGPRDEDRHALTRGLADIYEELTGKSPTAGRAGDGSGPSTRFGRFCQAALGPLFSYKITGKICRDRKQAARRRGPSDGGMPKHPEPRPG